MEKKIVPGRMLCIARHRDEFFAAETSAHIIQHIHIRTFDETQKGGFGKKPKVANYFEREQEK